jgi:hypothetical protein
MAYSCFPPSKYERQIIDQILHLLADGYSLVRALEHVKDDKKNQNKHIPTRQAIVNWKMKNTEGFTEQYEEARISGLECRFDAIYEIANDTSKDYLMDKQGNPILNKRGDMILNTVSVQSRRLLIDTMKWELSKMLPKKFGNHKSVEINGEAAGGNVQVVISKDDADL